MNKYQDEYLGKSLKVIQSKNKSLLGIKGKITKETKNTFVVDFENKHVTLLKNICVFEIQGRKIQGEKITKRPEDRIKIR